MPQTTQTTKAAGLSLRARSPLEILASNAMLFLPSILCLVAFAIYPLFYSARLSLTRLESAAGTPVWVGFQNYRDLMSDPQFWNAAMNSLLFGSATGSLRVLIGVGLGVVFGLGTESPWGTVLGCAMMGFALGIAWMYVERGRDGRDR